MLAISRVLLATTVFVLSASDSGNPGFETEPDDLLALAYLGLSIALVASYLANWWLSFRLRQAAIVLDFLAYLMVMLLIEPMHSGYFAASITLLAFLTLSVAIQWGWKRAVFAIVLLNLLCLAMIVQMLGMDMPMDWSPVLKRQAYQLLISFFLVWAASWVQVPRVTAFSIPPGLAPADQFIRALEFAREQLQAPTGALCWAGQGKGSCSAARIGLGDRDKDKHNFCPSSFVQLLPGPALFDLKRGRCIALNDGRCIQPQMTSDECEFAESFGVRRGIYIPLTGTSGKGRVVLGMPALAGADMLRFAMEIGKELTRSFDSESYYRSMKENSVAHVRNGIARDLHDNVAQSLAGTRYWLDSLLSRSKRGETINSELQDLSELISSEHSKVLGTIEYLLKPSGSFDEDLIAELRTLAETMSRHWRVGITLTGHPDPIMLSVDLVHELKAICREAVSNAVRHGHAGKISLQLAATPGELELAIANDGSEFEPGSTKPKTIDSRVRNLNGRLDIASRSGETRISIAIPLGAQ